MTTPGPGPSRDRGSGVPGSAAIAPPPVEFQGRTVPSAALADAARGWRDAVLDRVGDDGGPVALAMAHDLHTVELFFGLSALPGPLVLLPSDPASWRTRPALPAGTPLVLSPRLCHLAAEGVSLGLDVHAFDAVPRAGRAARDPAFLTNAGLVMFTSGSMGMPKPVYRRMEHVLGAVTARARAYGLVPGTGTLCSLPLDKSGGINNSLMMAVVTGGRFGLVGSRSPAAILRMLASGAYGYWATTVAVAALLTRLSDGTRVRAPAFSIAQAKLSPSLAERFHARFGSPLRSHYGTTETGAVTANAGRAADVRHDRVGHPIPGVELFVGDDPGDPPSDAAGRIWVRSPWMMRGYGLPGSIEPRVDVDGWWPTPDVGALDADGGLAIHGRADDRIRTGSGQILDLAEVVAVLMAHPGVRDAIAVPLESGEGTVPGAMVECEGGTSADALRRHLARALPPRYQPRVLMLTAELPRLPGGKADRRACTVALAARL